MNVSSNSKCKLLMAVMLLALAPMAQAVSTGIAIYEELYYRMFKVHLKNLNWDASDSEPNPCYQSNQCFLDIGAFANTFIAWMGPPPNDGTNGYQSWYRASSNKTDISGQCSSAAETMGALKPCVQQYLREQTFYQNLGGLFPAWQCPSLVIVGKSKSMEAMRGGLSCNKYSESMVQCNFSGPATIDYGNLSPLELGVRPLVEEADIGIDCSGKASATISMITPGNIELEPGVLSAKLYVQGQEVTRGPKTFDVPANQSTLKLKSELVAANPKQVQAKSYSGSAIISIEVN